MVQDGEAPSDGGQHGDVVLTDPRAVRALAHPARLAVIDELYSGSVLTATECAALVGLTPSAMSYHLRALEKWGVVVRADPAGDGRERPWRAAGRTLSMRPSGAVASRSVDALIGISVAQLQSELSAWSARRDPPDDPWNQAVTFSHAVARFTAAEAAALARELTELIDRHVESARTAASNTTEGGTDQRRRVSVWHALSPAVTGEPADSGWS